MAPKPLMAINVHTDRISQMQTIEATACGGKTLILHFQVCWQESHTKKQQQALHLLGSTNSLDLNRSTDSLDLDRSTEPISPLKPRAANGNKDEPLFQRTHGLKPRSKNPSSARHTARWIPQSPIMLVYK